jgi:hypothetical protein
MLCQRRWCQILRELDWLLPSSNTSFELAKSAGGLLISGLIMVTSAVVLAGEGGTGPLAPACGLQAVSC